MLNYEMYNFPIEELDVTLDKLYESHLAVWRWVRTHQGKTHVAKYYHYHRCENRRASTKH